MKIKKEYLMKYWKLTIVALIPVLVLITYLLVIIPFPPAMGINRDAWVGFFGSFFGGLLVELPLS